MVEFLLGSGRGEDVATVIRDHGAEALDATVVTCDGRLARAHGHSAHVVAV